jgi:hypothetical protein
VANLFHYTIGLAPTYKYVFTQFKLIDFTTNLEPLFLTMKNGKVKLILGVLAALIVANYVTKLFKGKDEAPTSTVKIEKDLQAIPRRRQASLPR